MKKTSVFALCLIFLAATFLFSCSDLASALGLTNKPELKTDSVGIKSLDMEKMTFNCDYSISNPYPIAFSVAGIKADVIYNGTDEIKNPPRFAVKTADGLTVNANTSSKNEMNFEVPYNTILQLVDIVQSLSGKTSLPFALAGDITLDLSSVNNETLGTVLDTLTTDRKLVIPFKKSFDVPVFKPSFTVDTPTIEKPSFESIKNTLIDNNVGLFDAISLATALISGSGFGDTAVSTLEKVDLDFGINFNLNVSNEGSAPWKFALTSCGLQNTNGGKLADVTPANETGTIDSASGRIPMKATLNTTKAAATIIKLLSNSAENPSFVLDSGITFTQLEEQYGLNLPLKYSYELPLH